jgi:hypothetical protein
MVKKSSVSVCAKRSWIQNYGGVSFLSYVEFVELRLEVPSAGFRTKVSVFMRGLGCYMNTEIGQIFEKTKTEDRSLHIPVKMSRYGSSRFITRPRYYGTHKRKGNSYSC